MSDESNQYPGRNTIKKPYNNKGIESYNANNDEAWTEDDNNSQSFFWLTTTTTDDEYYTE